MRLLRPVYLVEPYLLECLFGVSFNAIPIRWGAICPTSCTRRIAVLPRYFITCFLTFGDITFLRFVPLVVVVVPLCVFSLSEMLNALLISSFLRLVSNLSSFIRLVSTISSFIRLVSTLSSFIRLVSTISSFISGFNNFQFYSTGFNTTLSFDLGLPFLCPFLRDPFTRSVPAIHAILLLPFPYTCATFCAILFPFDKVV